MIECRFVWPVWRVAGVAIGVDGLCVPAGGNGKKHVHLVTFQFPSFINEMRREQNHNCPYTETLIGQNVAGTEYWPSHKD